ncbi:DUF1045 domain-containing protein [Thalassococcus sp. S3]|uniref:DUF1045 domain-containing protein n=1 Tax=Thalassococcus sp. S3 TaxID=2017482 RepID=UPI0010244336|nr:DUF1045 domain-containing protein [Thalassococcus sp. S3]QBF30661.1 phosphonate metabolism protein [Thalassococcus sp. S3]
MPPTRYAIYYAPPKGARWAQFGASWLGWDMLGGVEAAHPDLPLDISAITETPRKYGLHGTIKPPFKLAAEQTEAELRRACEALAGRLGPIRLDGLHLARLGAFLALRPDGAEEAIRALAATVVRTLDPFRAPADPAELERRRAANLTTEQEANLVTWGYPYVMDAFRFHITLTSRLPKRDLAEIEAILGTHLVPLLPRPFHITDLALVGEAADGRFHLLHRYTLSG